MQFLLTPSQNGNSYLSRIIVDNAANTVINVPHFFSILRGLNETDIIKISLLKQYKSIAIPINHKHVSKSLYVKNLIHVFSDLKIIKNPKIV